MSPETEPGQTQEYENEVIDDHNTRHDHETAQVPEPYNTNLAELEQAVDANAFATFLMDTKHSDLSRLFEAASSAIIHTGQKLNILPEDEATASEILRNAIEWLDPNNKAIRESPLQNNIAVNNLVDIAETFRQVDLHYIMRILSGELNARTAHEKALTFYRGEGFEDDGPDETGQAVRVALGQTPEEHSEILAHSVEHFGETNNFIEPYGAVMGGNAHTSSNQIGGPAHVNQLSPLGGAESAHSTRRFERAKPLSNQKKRAYQPNNIPHKDKPNKPPRNSTRA